MKELTVSNTSCWHTQDLERIIHQVYHSLMKFNWDWVLDKELPSRVVFSPALEIAVGLVGGEYESFLEIGVPDRNTLSAMELAVKISRAFNANDDLQFEARRIQDFVHLNPMRLRRRSLNASTSTRSV